MTFRSTADAISKKLAQEEEWMQNFNANIQKSVQINSGIEQLVEKFDQRLNFLEKSVLPMHIANGQLQRKQHNIQRLIKTIDTTVQFYGKTTTVENAIRSGIPSNDMNSYLENMECLQQAINFFESQTNYSTQTQDMQLTLESGFSILEKEFRQILQIHSLDVDSKIFVKLYTDQSALNSKLRDEKFFKDEELVIKLGNWLLQRGRTKFLVHYSDIRGSFMLKTIKLVLTSFMSGLSGANTKLKQNARKNSMKEKVVDSGELDGCLLMCSTLLALLEIEERIMGKAIPDTSKNAQVFRELVSQPLYHTISYTLKTVQEKEVGVMPLLPLLHFLSQNSTRFQNLALNSTINVDFDQLMRTLQVKCSSYINEVTEKLNDTSSKFVPSDGNIHPVTASTLSFLSSLTVHRITVTHQVLAMTAAPSQNTNLLLPMLFARVLSALGTMLRKKSELYDEPTLAKIFLLNNYNYIAKTLANEDDGLLPVISEQNTNILSFYHKEIANYVEEYMKSWNLVLAALRPVSRLGEEKSLARDIMTNFTREFDQLLNQQSDYCVSDVKLSGELKERARQLVWPPYAKLLDVCSRLHSIPQGVKYTEHTFNAAVNNLFSASGVR